MPDVHFTNLLIVVAAAFLAPLALGFFPRLRVPAIVVEILLGIMIGPSVLGWATPDLPVSILSLIGLGFLLFLAGLEIDPRRLRGPIVRQTGGAQRANHAPLPKGKFANQRDREVLWGGQDGADCAARAQLEQFECPA